MEDGEDTGLRAAIVPVTPLQQNCSIVWNETSMTGAVVDPGGDIDIIQQAIAEVGVRVEKIVLTHGHVDHAAGATALADKLGVPIEGPHIADKFLLDDIATQAQKFGIANAQNVSPARWLAEGDSLAIGGLAFEIFHCPGHSPGSLVYVQRASRFALMGDVLFRGSIGRTDFPYGDHDALITAIKTKLLPLGDDVAFICGHGQPSTIGDERQMNPFIR